MMTQTEDAVFYQLYFQTSGVAEAELEHDVRRSIPGLLYSASGDAPRSSHRVHSPGMVPRSGGFLDTLADSEELLNWLTDADVDFYVQEFVRTGFRGGLNWYRNIDRNWELSAPFSGMRVSVPALYVAGDRDLVVGFRAMDIANLEHFAPQLRGKIILPGCGHWTQQERTKEVNEAMIEFLRQFTR